MPGYAENAEDAKTELKAYCKTINFDHEWISPSQWAATIRIAQDKKLGYKEAFKTIDTDLDDMRKAVALARRKATLAGDASNLLTAVKYDRNLKDSLVVTILAQCAKAYEGGERVNLGLGGSPMDEDAFTDLRGEWDEAAALADGGIFTDFVSHDPEDKAALGKGSVGGTLAKRKVQGNLLVRIAGVRFNMHIDIK